MTKERHLSNRLAIVDEHVSLENQHDLDGIMNTFGSAARYDEEPWNEHHVGRDAVQRYYAELLQAMPDLHLDVRQRHAAAEAVVLEVVVKGHHLGTWRRLPSTGRQVQFPLCGIFTFDQEDRLAGERIYYDRATVLRQLGVFHEPDRMPGRIEAILMHPFTMARAIGRILSGRHTSAQESTRAGRDG